MKRSDEKVIDVEHEIKMMNLKVRELSTKVALTAALSISTFGLLLYGDHWNKKNFKR